MVARDVVMCLKSKVLLKRHSLQMHVQLVVKILLRTIT
jgi:hypothetical protein